MIRFFCCRYWSKGGYVDSEALEVNVGNMKDQTDVSQGGWTFIADRYSQKSFLQKRAYNSIFTSVNRLYEADMSAVVVKFI